MFTESAKIHREVCIFRCESLCCLCVLCVLNCRVKCSCQVCLVNVYYESGNIIRTNVNLVYTRHCYPLCTIMLLLIRRFMKQIVNPLPQRHR